MLPSLYIPGAGLKSRSQLNSGKNSPKNRSPSPSTGVNFEFCKGSNEEVVKNLTEPKQQEVVNKESSPPKSALLRNGSKGNVLEKKTSTLKTQNSITTSKTKIGFGISKVQSYQKINTSPSPYMNTTYKKAPTKAIEIEKVNNPYAPPKKLATTPQSRTTTEFGIKSKFLKTEVKKEKEKEKEVQKPKESPIAEKQGIMHNLSDEEKANYGDRFPTDYTKLDFLGR